LGVQTNTLWDEQSQRHKANPIALFNFPLFCMLTFSSNKLQCQVQFGISLGQRVLILALPACFMHGQLVSRIEFDD